MNHQIFAWDRSYSSVRLKKPWIEYFYLVSLLLAALVLFSWQLGSVPLTSEETVLVDKARQIQEKVSIFPLVPKLIYWSYALQHGTVNAWTTRLPGAFLTAVSVPLLYSLSRELYVARWPGLFASLMYLMAIPVVCSGRLAGITGASLCLMIWTIACLLRSRRNLSWGLGVGIGLSLMSLTDGMSFLILCSVIIIFIAWDTPRLLSCTYFVSGVFLGILPAFLWYGLFFHANHHRILTFFLPLGHSWRNGLDFVVLSAPWFVFWASGVKLAFESLTWSWAKLVLVWLAVSWSFVILLSLKAPELVILSIPTLSLAGGTILAEVKILPKDRSLPCFWRHIFLSISAVASLFSVLLFHRIISYHLLVQQTLLYTFIALTITLAFTARLIAQRDQDFISTLFWGMYLVLLLLLSSVYWTKLC